MRHKSENRVCYFVCLFMALLSSPAFATHDAPQPLDTLVAVVNDHVITASELQKQVNLMQKQLSEQNLPIPKDAALRKQTLDRLIENRILLDAAKAQNVMVDDLDISQTIQSILAENHLTMQQLQDTLQKSGISMAEYKKQMKTQIVISKLQHHQLDSSISISEAEIDAALKQVASENKVASAYHIQHILIDLPDSPSSEQVQTAKQTATKVVHEIKQGNDFSKLAVTYSKAPEAMNGGDWGWKNPAELPEVFAKALSKMSIGSVSDPIRTGNGFHIIKLLATKNDALPNAPSNSQLSELHVRHILLVSPNTSAKAVVLDRIKQIRSHLLMGNSFEQTAMSHSEDPASAPNGGDLGWVRSGALPPELEKVALHLKIGEVSQPIHSSVGWHLVQVVGRRGMAANPQNNQKRLAARNLVYNKKFELARNKWIQQLRSEAYVKIVDGNATS